MTAPKTWAGRQEIHRIARAAQEALPASSDALFDYGCVLRKPHEYVSKDDSKKLRSKVEPFYFDGRRFAHRLDIGFSLDVQEVETIAYPAVELLALIGLQRFRPKPLGKKWQFQYWTWRSPLSAVSASAVAAGAIAATGSCGYIFSLLFRDDQKRYKAFGFSTLAGGE